MAQVGLAAAFDVDMTPHVEAYRKKRDLVVDAFAGIAHLENPGGAFYAFVEVPQRLGLSASAFVEKAIEQSVLIIPGKVFSRRDSHFRLSYAVPANADGRRQLMHCLTAFGKTIDFCCFTIDHSS
jgi:aspartate aminotransferase/aminotransferase